MAIDVNKRTKRNNKAHKKMYDSFSLTVRKGEGAALLGVAARNNISRNKLIITALNDWLSARGYDKVMVKADGGED